MSAERTAQRNAAAQQGGMFGRGPMGGIGMPVRKAKNFKGTLARLSGYLEPHRPALVDRDRDGRPGHAVQRRRSQDPRPGDDEDFRRVSGSRSRGTRRAHRLLVRRPDSAATDRSLSDQRRVSVPAAVSDGGVAQKTVYRIRQEVEAKFERLPLKFYDSRTHGEILSRAVNDMDASAQRCSRTSPS